MKCGLVPWGFPAPASKWPRNGAARGGRIVRVHGYPPPQYCAFICLLSHLESLCFLCYLLESFGYGGGTVCANSFFPPSF